MTAILSFFSGGFVSYIVALGMGAILAGGGVGYVEYKIMHGDLLAYQLSDAKAQTAAVAKAGDLIHRQDGVILDAAVAEAVSQQKIVTNTVTITKRIVEHEPATNNPACITFGLVRLVNAAAVPSNSDSSNAASQSDDACAPLTWRSFASDITDDLGTASANGEQLNALEANITDIVKTANGRTK